MRKCENLYEKVCLKLRKYEKVCQMLRYCETLCQRMRMRANGSANYDSSISCQLLTDLIYSRGQINFFIENN